MCKDCGFEFYRNVAAAVAVVVRFENEVLFTIRSMDPGKGKLDLPGGFADPDESLEEVARRELREELQLELPTLGYLFSEPNVYPYKGVNYRTLDAFFDARFDRRPVTAPGDDVAGVVWQRLDDVKMDRIALPSIKKGIARIADTTFKFDTDHNNA